MLRSYIIRAASKPPKVSKALEMQNLIKTEAERRDQENGLKNLYKFNTSALNYFETDIFVVLNLVHRIDYNETTQQFILDIETKNTTMEGNPALNPFNSAASKISSYRFSKKELMVYGWADSDIIRKPYNLPNLALSDTRTLLDWYEWFQYLISSLPTSFKTMIPFWGLKTNRTGEQINLKNALVIKLPDGFSLHAPIKNYVVLPLRNAELDHETLGRALAKFKKIHQEAEK
jgi:hypothetical protein